MDTRRLKDKKTILKVLDTHVVGDGGGQVQTRVE